MWTDLLVIIALPYALRFVAGYLGGKKAASSAVPSGENRGRHDRMTFQHPAVLLLLSGLIASAYFALTHSPSTFFDLIQAPYDAPNFLMRNRFREYCSWKSGQDPNFDLSSNTRRSIERMSRIKKEDHQETGEPLSEHEWLTDLFELLKSTQNRHTYLTFGEDAFVNCPWCKTDNDFLLYSAPSILFQYAVILLVFGLATIPVTKRHLRIYLGSCVMGLLMFEVVYLILPSEYQRYIIAEVKPMANAHSLLFQMRWFVFGALMLVCLCLERLDFNESERLQMILQSQEKQLHQIKAQQLQHMAMMDDEELRKVCFDYHQSRSQSRQAIRTKPELETIRLRAQVMHHALHVGSDHTITKR